MRVPLLAVTLLAAACHDDVAPVVLPHQPPPPPLPLLSADGEAYWAHYVGSTPGAPGPDALAFCREPEDDHGWYIYGRHITLVQTKERRCALTVSDDVPVLRRELATIVARWQRLAPPVCNGATWIVPDEPITAQVIDARSLAIHWRAHLALDELVGADRLLRDVDVEAFARAPDLPLAVERPFHACHNTTCLAQGPSAPGGFETTVFRADPPAIVGVRIGAADTRAVVARIAQLPPNTSLAYRVREDPCSVTVLVEPK